MSLHPPGEAAEHLALHGRFTRASRMGAGHINDTFLAEFEGAEPLVLQRVNSAVFPDPEGVMANIERVTDHLARRCPDERRALRLVRAKDGRAFWRDAAGELWRAYRCVEGTLVKDVVGGPWEAYEAARAFGAFQYLMSDLPGGPLEETLPGFHDTPGRLKAFEASVREDRAGRAAAAKAEIDAVFSRRAWAERLAAAARAGLVPVRVTHNDTKINNVLFDAASGKGLCVIDLDTVMPGLMLYDFGDFVRTAVSPAPEDEADLSRVQVRTEVFEALAQGWRDGSGGMISEEERALLPSAGRVIAYELGMRFLKDHLDGDRYFRVHRPNHNLERARCQLRLASEIFSREAELALYC
ncbi:MAG: aminoglycoside phosphotransferase family protein [Elusimicrobia bacterium]|nr:aminoglycoside phosphotransferase family protein [Elusimicrobiota bacterium]